MYASSKDWYLLYTRPRKENNVASHLKVQNIDYFLPKIKTIRQWHDRKKEIELPLFPNYIFVNVTSIEELYACQNMEGVCCYVRFGKQPALVSQAVIDSISHLIKDGVNVSISSDRFMPGERVNIQQGALAGLDCEVVQYQGKEKLLVRVDLLSRNLLVDVAPGFLSKMA